MIPSAAIRIWYRNKLDSICAQMIKEYRETINKTLDTRPVKKFFTQDAAASQTFEDVLGLLDKRWKSIFKGFAKQTAKDFVSKSTAHADASTIFTMSAAGINQPTTAYNENILNTLNAAQNFNNTLITNIQADVHEKIYSAVMLSLTSPNPEQQGQSGIENALREAGGFSKERTKLIARDQTSKLYSSLMDERMEQNGVEEFEWMHSSAGKVPRQSHVDKDGEIFKIDDPRLWEGKKADQGPPGWAINCRCRRRIVIR